MAHEVEFSLEPGTKCYVSYGSDDLTIAGRVVTVEREPDEDGMVRVTMSYKTIVDEGLLTPVNIPED